MADRIDSPSGVFPTETRPCGPPAGSIAFAAIACASSADAGCDSLTVSHPVVGELPCVGCHRNGSQLCPARLPPNPEASYLGSEAFPAGFVARSRQNCRLAAAKTTKIPA